MNTNMYTHPATQANLETLRSRGCHVVGPGSGRLACGTVGEGRLIEPNVIVEAALPLVSGKRDLAGKHVVITSGANHEPIDPVRFIGNRSSGKMGRALALEALMRGAQVTVVSGPSNVALPYGAEVVRVETALEMADAALPLAKDADVFVAAAAVADYRVEDVAAQKRKRGGEPLTLTLTENPDILAQVGAAKRDGQVVVGFAAETNDVVENARVKIEKKHLDLIVACQVNTPDSGFGCDGLNAAVLDASAEPQALTPTAKEDLAEALFDRVAALLGDRFRT
jgi:phosphopantothenoylcysteine decarboxylase/phosphopantothenate--cysteine ligase